MKVTGFSFIRNAVQYDYPVLEAIHSVLPLCDEFVIAVGKSDDGTLELIKGIPSDKIKIIETVWDDTLREGAVVLAKETDKALAAVAEDSDWCFYIQGDECVHEDDHALIKKEMEATLHDPRIEGLLFKYKHFYGSYDYIGASAQWYRREIRLFKYNKQVRSYRDAQGFRLNDRKLRVKLIDAYIYHYGWVKHPRTLQAKSRNFHKLHHSDEWIDKNIYYTEEFDFSNVDKLKRFTGTHPAVFQPRADAMNWKFTYDPTQVKFKKYWRYRLKEFVEKLTGHRIAEYRNYKLVK